jgi:hypothetical protein
MISKLAIFTMLPIVASATPQIARAQAQPEIGRYQLAIPSNKDYTALLIDTVTGRSWILGIRNDRRWHDLNFGEVQNGHLMLMPAPCTQDNPTCYFALPPAKESSSTETSAQGEKAP